VDLPGPDVLWTEIRWRAADVAGEGGDLIDVGLLRGLGEVPNHQVFDHPLA